MRIRSESREISRIDTAGTAQAASMLDVPELPAISRSHYTGPAMACEAARGVASDARSAALERLHPVLVSVSHGQKGQQSAPDHSSSILARTVESPTRH